MNKYFCDLGIVLLEIDSEISVESKFLNLRTDKKSNVDKEVVKIYISRYSDYEKFPFDACTYREKIMQQGFYIGHHFGESVKIKILSKNEIYICAQDYDRILWSYVVKFILTLFCIENNYLHIKAGAIEYCGKNLLIVGRGESGKTEFIRALLNDGAMFITNTHSIIKNKSVRGIDAKTRIRNDGKEFYSNLGSNICIDAVNAWRNIDAILWVKYRKDNILNIEEMNKDCMYYHMKQFSEAISNWELHEDVYDYYNSELQTIFDKLYQIEKKLHYLIDNCKTYFINCDMFNSQNRIEIKKFVKNL